MKILFSPSESKTLGGCAKTLDSSSYLFPELFCKRMEVLTLYHSFLKNASDDQLYALFGTKNSAPFKEDIFKAPTLKAIQRYNGVAYEYLDYASLDANAQAYIDAHVVIFSNLLGPLLAGDGGVPAYKLKQGERIGGFCVEAFYKEHFSAQLDTFLKGHVVLDLRAGFYEKFYKPTQPYITIKFIKNGKVISHWAKAYRGILLRQIAKHNIQTSQALMQMPVPNLALVEIKEQGLKQEFVFSIA